MVGLDIEEAKTFIEDEQIERKRLEELVGKAVSAEAMITINFVNNVYEKARTEARIMESADASQGEIYKKLDFYCDLLYVIRDQMCSYKYPPDRRDDVDVGIDKLDELMDRYRKKQDKPTKPTMQAPAPAPNTQGASYTQQTIPCKGSTGQSSAQSSKAPSQLTLWSTKDKRNIDRLLDNFNKRQKKQ